MIYYKLLKARGKLARELERVGKIDIYLGCRSIVVCASCRVSRCRLAVPVHGVLSASLPLPRRLRHRRSVNTRTAIGETGASDLLARSRRSGARPIEHWLKAVVAVSAENIGLCGLIVHDRLSVSRAALHWLWGGVTGVRIPSGKPTCKNNCHENVELSRPERMECGNANN